eukprot:TRINITY_DN14050_c0_g1_i1.p1 TRINITY_DN14050_c0_g1~~TRINITY_DN14050_c0_g1_i1.p1  ORF type:complete len:447 (+),score=105.76 TRINITY_DN14050_c0_g1_i1:82-1341(+)
MAAGAGAAAGAGEAAPPPPPPPRPEPEARTDAAARLGALEQEVASLRTETALLEERLRVLAQTGCVDPCARHPAGEPWTSREFRREVEQCVNEVSASYDGEELPEVHEYLWQVLYRLEDHNAGNASTVPALCPDGHGVLGIKGGDYTQWDRLIKYERVGPRFCERINMRIALVWMTANTLMNCILMVRFFMEEHWWFAASSVVCILISDIAQSLAWRDLMYKDADKQVYPLTWPARLHYVPLIGGAMQGFHILLRSRELGRWRTSRGQQRNAYDVTHAQLLYHSQVYGLFLRVIFHTVPLLCQLVVIHERSHDLGLQRIPGDDWFIAGITTGCGLVLWTLTLIGWNTCCGTYPSPTSRANLWGLPPFQHGWRTLGLAVLLFAAIIVALYPVVWTEGHYPPTPSPAPAGAPNATAAGESG